jgi:hypothetical protein
VISRYAPLCVVLVLGIVGAPSHAAGQSKSRFGGGLALGVTPNLAEGFSTDQICKHRTAMSASGRATFALTDIIQLEALGEVFVGPGNQCVNGLVPPPPLLGPHTRVIDYYDGRITDPPTVLALRIGALLPKAAPETLRPYVGIARFSGKGITTPLAGLSILGGGSERRLLLEIEAWWYSVPKQHLEEEFLDGVLVSRTLTERGVRTFTAIIRLGFTSSVGGSLRRSDRQ